MFSRLNDLWLALSPASRVAVVVWVSVTAGVFGRVLGSPPRSQTVVPIYLAAGQKWRDSKDLYRPTPGLDLYRNPPGFAAAFAVLTPLPEKVSGLLWRGGCLAVFLLGLARFRRDVVPDLSADRAAWLFTLAAPLALAPLNNGQANLLLAGCALNGVAATVRGRWWAAAGWFAAMGWVKVYPLAVGLLAALTAPRRLGVPLLIVCAVGFAAPFAFDDPKTVLEHYRRLVESVAFDDQSRADYQRLPVDWSILPRTWLGWTPGKELTAGVSLAAAAVAAWSVVRSLRERIPKTARSASGLHCLVLGSVWMTAFGPATEMNTYSVLAGVAAYLVVAPTPRPRWADFAAVVGYALLVASVLRCAFPEDWRFQVLGPQAVGALLVAAAAVARPATPRAVGFNPTARLVRLVAHD
jgi:hypothetical protein